LLGEKSNAYIILDGKPVGKGPPGRRRRKWVDNIKRDLRKNEMVWTGLIWLRIETTGRLL
jgi:hypothetical protein